MTPGTTVAHRLPGDDRGPSLEGPDVTERQHTPRFMRRLPCLASVCVFRVRPTMRLRERGTDIIMRAGVAGDGPPWHHGRRVGAERFVSLKLEA
jgi:hypothetical protein